VTLRTLRPALLAAALAASSVAAPSAAAPFVATLALTMATGDAAAQSGPGHTRRNSIVIVTGQLATLPIPTLMEGAASSVANGEIADQLFLRLANLGPTLTTAGDKDFVPMLARSWSRRDSLTLVFELDPRARWHDGAPVTARDVVFTYERSRDPRRAPRVSNLLRHITAVTAEGDRRVVFRFARRYAEQFYDATWHVQPLPAHLLDTVPADRLERSAFVTSPVGNGPYQWGRSVPGQFIELTANGAFFLGRPKIERVIVRLAADPDARLNLLLSGEADAADNIPPPLGNIARVAAAPGLRVIPVPSPTVGYLLFNQRNPADRSAPHPVLTDIRVRRAITLALDRKLMNQKVLGPYGSVPYGPVAPYLWIRYGAPEPLPQNQAEARRLLAAAGWQDRGPSARAPAQLPRDERHPAPARAARAGAAPRRRHSGRPPAARRGGLAGAALERQLRHRLLFREPGPLAIGVDAELVVRRRQQRRPLLQSGGRLADRPGDARARPPDEALAPGTAPNRGRRAGGLRLRPRLRHRRAPALRRRRDPAGIVVARALAVVGQAGPGARDSLT
jgi:ABC-type transport system substrate-binding protein